MGRALLWGTLGLLLGFTISFGSKGSEIPLSPSSWTNSALLSAYHKLEWEAHLPNEQLSYPDAPSTQARATNLEDARRRMASVLGQRPRSLLGEFIFEPQMKNLHSGRQAIRVSCSATSECCSQFLRWNEEKGAWETWSASSALDRGYFDENAHFVMALKQFFPPEYGLSFVGPFAEIPLVGQGETHLLGKDPDTGRWEMQGKLRWTPGPSLEACL